MADGEGDRGRVDTTRAKAIGGDTSLPVTTSATVEADSFLTTPDVVLVMDYQRVEGARGYVAGLAHGRDWRDWRDWRGQIGDVADDEGRLERTHDPVTDLDRWPL